MGEILKFWFWEAWVLRKCSSLLLCSVEINVLDLAMWSCFLTLLSRLTVWITMEMSRPKKTATRQEA